MKNMKTMLLALALPLSMAHAQNNSTKTLGKSSYKIVGNYIGTGNSALYSEYDSPDSIRTYAKITSDTLYVTQEMYKKGNLIRAKYSKVNYKHPKIKIGKPDEKFYNFKIGIENNYDNSNNSIKTYLATHDFTSSSNTAVATLYFNSKEQAEAFYASLKSGTPSDGGTSAPVAASGNSGAKDDSAKELKIGLSNKSKTKIQICYEKSPGSRDLNYNTINSGSTITIFAKAGCKVYYVNEGSKEKQGVLLQIAENMHQTEQVIAK